MIRKLSPLLCNLFLSMLFISTFSIARDNEVITNIGTSKLRIQIITPSIIRVSYSPSSGFSERKSLSVIPVKEPADAHLIQSADKIVISTEKLEVSINKKDGSIKFADKSGEVLTETIPADTSAFIKTKFQNENAYHIKQGFRISKDEGLFGLGQYEDGIMNFRSRDVIIAQANRVAVNPFLVSSKGYGILWDNYSWTKFHDGDDGCYFYSEIADEIDYYFVYGSKIDDAISGYRTLTGKAPMFGLWAYGYWQSKERYMSSDELINVIKEYRSRKIPIDNIIQDWQYWGDMDHFSGMCWDSIRYKDPKAMMDTLHRYNAHMIASIWPAFGPKSNIFQEMEKNKLLFNVPHWSGGKVYDPYNPLGRQVYWKHLKKSFLDNNVDGYWMDGSEPEFRCSDDRFITAQSIKECGSNYLGSMARYLNPYSLMHTKGVYENQRAESNSKRVFILTRSAFTGQQRYGSVTWSGDIFASWQTFKNQIAAGINFSMSGIPYWTTDIGAFITSFKYPEGVKDDAYKELYVRWFQFGAFCPIFRAHGTNTPREIWQFGEKGHWAYDALVKTDELRYRLLPYIYSTAWKVTDENYTMLRGLPMDFAKDKRTLSVKDEFMFGPFILVCPVTKEIYHHSQLIGEDIESSYFFTKDGNENGLTMEVFRGNDLMDRILSRKFDASQLGWSGCLPEKLDTCYSLRLEGKLLSENKGEYTFKIITDGGVRFWADNKMLIDNWENTKNTEMLAKINLNADTKYDLKIEHRQNVKNNALLKINWIKPEDCNKESELSEVYLPEKNDGTKTVKWFDFWTGEKNPGGQTIVVKTPIDMLPLYVPEGSIIPLGPEVQYADEKKNDPIEIRIYDGKDADFTIYEDEGDSYNYEKGDYSTIKLSWNDRSHTLTVGERNGKFPGMPEVRIFNIIIVKEGRGCGISSTDVPDKTIKYSGKELKITL